jgi:hypothetical protein
MSDLGDVSLKEFLQSVLAERDARYNLRFDEAEKRYDQRFKAQETATSAALVNTKEALTIALTAVKEGNASTIAANKVLAAKAEEFADQKLQTHNAIKPWVQTMIDALDDKVAALEKRVSRFENREEGIGWTTKAIISAVALVSTLVGLYFALR